MKKYVGQYRVICERDVNGAIADRDNLYIRCYGGKQIYRYGKDILAFAGGCNVCNKIVASVDGAKILVSAVDETIAIFPEDKLGEVDAIVHCVTSGAKISPWSEKHYNPFYVKQELSPERKAELQKRMSEIRKGSSL